MLIGTKYFISVIQNIEGFKAKNVLDIQITAENNSTSITATVIMDIEAAWQKIEAGFLVSSRKDLLVGNFILCRLSFIQQITNFSTL